LNEEENLKEKLNKKFKHKKNEILCPDDVRKFLYQNHSNDTEEFNPCTEQTRIKTEKYSEDENQFQNDSENSNIINIFNMPQLLSPNDKNNNKNTNVNISLYEFENIFDKEEDVEILKKVAKQKLFYFIEQTEKEENDLNNKEIEKNYLSLKYKNLNIHKNQGLCKKFVEHPEKFYSETPSDILLKSLNLNPNKYSPTSISKSQNKKIFHDLKNTNKTDFFFKNNDIKKK
jgi:hypothetical protein